MTFQALRTYAAVVPLSFHSMTVLARTDPDPNPDSPAR